jgi:hypothetical protein
MASKFKDPIPKLTGAKFTGGGQDGTYTGAAYSEKKFDKTFSGKPASGAFGDVAPNGEGAPDTGYVDDGRSEKY